MNKTPENALAPASLALLEAAYPGARGAARRSVLSHALRCFNDMGIEATTIDDLRRRSEQSVGTIYHHFKNKEGVAAALFFTGLDDQSRAIDEAVSLAGTAQAMVAALIAAYLQWVTRLPDMAMYLLLARETIAKGPGAEQLGQRLHTRYQPLDDALAQAMRRGDIQQLPEDVIPALILGPAESYCRAWLAGRRQTPPEAYAALLAATAWKGISAA